MLRKIIRAGITVVLLQTAVFAEDTSESLASMPMVMEKLPPDVRPNPQALTQNARGGNARWVSSNRWKPGETLRVAFYGGTPELHKKIAQIAPAWTRHGNIKFDFGYNPATGKHRSWSPSDTQYAAEIRIIFGNDGYWSALGTDSIKAPHYGPGKPSMNLQAQHTPASLWQRVILHEFGHALGFGHEHQHPCGGCDAEFRWADDPGYEIIWEWHGPSADDIAYVPDKAGRKPGMYTSMFGAPNKWNPSYVDFQMRQIQPSSAYTASYKLGPVDRKSIMHYRFDPMFFKKGAASPCCVEELEVLSEYDKAGVKANYP